MSVTLKTLQADQAVDDSLEVLDTVIPETPKVWPEIITENQREQLERLNYDRRRKEFSGIETGTNKKSRQSPATCPMSTHGREFAAQATLAAVPISEWPFFLSKTLHTPYAQHCLIGATTSQNSETRLPLGTSDGNSNDRIQLLGISSCALLHEIARLTDTENRLNHEHHVLRWPFNLLVLNQKKFRQRIEQLRIECADNNGTFVKAAADDSSSSGPDGQRVGRNEETRDEHVEHSAKSESLAELEDTKHVQPPSAKPARTVSTDPELRTIPLPDPPSSSRAERLIQELLCLVEVLEHNILRYLNPEKVSFEDLPHYFQPGTLVVWSDTSSQCYCVLRNSNDSSQTFQTEFWVESFTISFDGRDFYPEHHKNFINFFKNERHFASLPGHPMLINDVQRLEELKLRGEKFLQVARSPGTEMWYSPRALAELHNSEPYVVRRATLLFTPSL